jgi:hypothetical protein
VVCAFIAGLLCAAGTSVARSQQSGEGQAADELIQSLYEERMQITRAELDWTVELLEHKDHPKLKGAVHKYHGWYDFLEGRVRVDVDSNVPSDAALTKKSRVAFSGGRYLIVESEHYLGWELEGYGLEYMRDKTSGAPFQLSTDPRLLAVLPARFALLKNYGLASILEVLYTSRDYQVSEEEWEGRTLTKLQFVGYQGADCSLAYWLDGEVGMMPVRILCEATSDIGLIRNELESKWQGFDCTSSQPGVVWMPIEIVARRWINEDLVTHERFLLHDAAFGERPDDALFTWKAMELPDDFVVKQVSGKVRRMKQWDAESLAFGEWDAEPLVEADLPRRTGPAQRGPGARFATRLFIAANVLIGIGLVAYALLSRWARHRRVRG